MIFYGVELFESIELFGICGQSSYGWAIIDVVWYMAVAETYTIQS